jgi:carbamoyl-phosphate synthase large subunit
MNVQFAVKYNPDNGENEIYIIEVNPRASRTVPFVAKATGTQVAKIAARVMAGERLSFFRNQGLLKGMTPDHIAVKAPVFPFSRFPGVDPILGPEMKSTGEVIGLDREIGHAFAKSQIGAGIKLPASGTVFLSVKDDDKEGLIPLAKELSQMGFKLVATGGTCTFLKNAGLNVTRINKVMEGQPHIVDAMINGQVQLVINTVEGAQATADSFSLRRTALVRNIPHYTNLSGARAAVAAITALQRVGVDGLSVGRLQDFLENTAKAKRAA